MSSARFLSSWTVACQASLSFTIFWSLFKFMSIASMVPSNHLILCHPLLLLPSIFPSIKVFSNESALCIRWPKYWSFSFSILQMNIQNVFPLGLIGLISLLSKGLLRVFSRKPQFKSINSLVLSLLHGPILTSIHDYWENHSFDYMNISWLQSLSTVILEPKKIKSATVSIFAPCVIGHEVMGSEAMILVFLNIEFQANFFTFLFHVC